VDLLRVDLEALCQIGHRRLLPQRLRATFAFNAPSIFRIVRFVIARSV
jgi:hypothetical protein